MSRRRRAGSRVTKADRPSTTLAQKAKQVGAVTFNTEQLMAVARAAQQSPSTGVATPLPRNPEWMRVPFGPGQPLFPSPVNAPRKDGTGRPDPRQWEIPVSWNLPGFSDRLIPWAILRRAADIPLFRQCIETRKNEIATLEWDIMISSKAVEQQQRHYPNEKKLDIVKAMTIKVQPEIERLTKFWELPDRWNGRDFIAWATTLLEEYFVLDALAIYPRMTVGGDIYSFEILDGSTVKPLLDEYGRRPMPPNPAYQQILYGFPRGEFIADIAQDPQTGEDIVLGGFKSDRLVYKPHHTRTHTPYGHPAVERALEDGDLWMRRHGWLKSEYTDGVMPSGWLEAGEGQAEWTPSQLAEYERAFNDYYAGQTELRQRFRILPFGMKPQKSTDLGERYKPDYDLFLLKLVARHFDTTIAELGFTEPGGLGSSGWHEGQADVQQRTANRPTLARIQKLNTWLMRQFMGAPRELEFRFLGLSSEDEAADDEIWNNRVKSGRATYNEDRDRSGLPRYDFIEADMPMIMTDRGVIFPNGAASLAPPGMMISPAPFMPQPAGFEGQMSGNGTGIDPKLHPTNPDQAFHQSAAPYVGANSSHPAPTPVLDKVDEIGAWKRWSRGNKNPNRKFLFQSVTKADFVAAGLDPELHNVLFKAETQPRPHHGDRVDHHATPDYTPADIGVPSLGAVELDPQVPNVDRQHYQRELDTGRVKKYRKEPKDKLGSRWGLVAQRPDGSYWIINGAHHTAAAILEGIPALAYRVFQSTGWKMEQRVYAAWEKWHAQYDHDDQDGE